jgi:hypothetical protein
MVDRVTDELLHERGETDSDTRCPCCGRGAPRHELTGCAGCGRSVCGACVQFYGHYMLMCEDCRLEPW